MRVAKAHRLVEKTWTATRADVRKNHKRWLADHQHIRYMWIPHTDCVVVVGSNPLAEGADAPPSAEDSPERARRKTEPMRRLLRQCAPEVDGADMGFGQLRDELLKVAPLDLEHVKRVNAAEAEFWRRNSGQRCDWSDRILGFDCGGQQHVYEVAFRTGDSVETNTGADLEYMAKLLEMIEREGIPAPAPIEQRWSAGSASPLSPATNVRPTARRAGPSCTAGSIIMYLPATTPMNVTPSPPRSRRTQRETERWARSSTTARTGPRSAPATRGAAAGARRTLRRERFPRAARVVRP